MPSSRPSAPPRRGETGMRYPFVLLDAGGTLIGPRESWGAVYAGVLRRLGLDRPADVFDRAVRRVWTEMERTVPLGADRYGFFDGGEDGYWLRFVAGAIGHAADGEAPPGLAEKALPALRQAFRVRSAWTVFPDVRETLATLRLLGVRLAIVSNWDSRLPHLLDVLDLDGFFDGVAVSHLLGFEKPDVRIFEAALAMIGGDRSRAIHVGDRPDLDLGGARAAGIAAALVNRDGRLGPAAGALADLRALPSIVLEGRS